MKKIAIFLNAKQKLKVGDYFYSTYHYDRVIITFYIITKIISEKTIMVQEVHQTVDHGNSYTEYVIPDKSRKVGEPIKKIIHQKSDGSLTISTKADKNCKLWDGKPKEQTVTN